MKLPFLKSKKRRRPTDMAGLVRQAGSNIALARALLETEPFRTIVKPVPADLAAHHRYMVLAPHQDDEAVGVGGTLMMLRDLGAEITVVYLTDGAEKGDEGAAIVERGEEAAAACALIGAHRIDIGISNVRTDPSLAEIDALASALGEVRPEVVLVPWLLDGTVKHRMANHLLWLANRRAAVPKPAEVWGYQVNNFFDPNAYVDITSVAERKRALLSLYRSQNEKLYSFDHMGMGLSAWNSKWLPKNRGRHQHKYGEIFQIMPLADHLDLIERFYFANLDETYLGYETVIAGMRAIHQQVAGDNS